MHHLLVMAIMFLTHGAGPKCVDIDALAYSVEYEADQNGVDPFMVLAIIANESDFDACEVSADKKDLGLMQLRVTGAGKGLKRRWLLDPSINVHVGVAYFAAQQRACKTFITALRAYNAGSCRSVKRLHAKYSKHVLKRYFSLSKLTS
jgi:soluble lytic murein transglycosylase-like protein